MFFLRFHVMSQAMCYIVSVVLCFSAVHMLFMVLLTTTNSCVHCNNTTSLKKHKTSCCTDHPFDRAFLSLISNMCSRRSFLGVPCCALCVLVTTALAERVVLLDDDTFVSFENSRASVEVTVPPFVLGGNLPIRYIPLVRLCLSHYVLPYHCLVSRCLFLLNECRSRTSPGQHWQRSRSLWQHSGRLHLRCA